jgi:hypothetical protein
MLYELPSVRSVEVYEEKACAHGHCSHGWGFESTKIADISVQFFITADYLKISQLEPI